MPKWTGRGDPFYSKVFLPLTFNNTATFPFLLNGMTQTHADRRLMAGTMNDERTVGLKKVGRGPAKVVPQF